MTYYEQFQNDIIRCHNTEKADVRFQDGALRHAIGTHCYQIMRASKDPAYATDGIGWTYNHASMIVYWNKRLFVDYLSDPVSEHLPPSQTLITSSADGVTWEKPQVLFPPIDVPSAPYCGPSKEELTDAFVSCVMHQRMSFYVTSDNRLLATGFYGIAPNHGIAPNNGYGVGRVVREVYKDLTFSPIYFLRFNEKGGYNKENTTVFPHFSKSSDYGFVKGCEEFLNNRLLTQQMWEEERLDTEFFTQPGAEALSYYTLPDGDVVGLYKKSLVTKTSDKGETWTDKEVDYSIETSTGKVWGQKTTDGRYALAYNPSTDSAHRWPIAVVTGDNGQDFDDLLAVTPEVSPYKYNGLYKNLGPQYIRGICEANPQTEDNSMWLTYSVNKEDIWVSRIPLPIHGTETTPVCEDFNNFEEGGYIPNWNIYAPAWCPVRIETAPDNGTDKALCLHDADPYDRSRAMRVFPVSKAIQADMDVYLDSGCEKSDFTIEIQDRHGSEAVRFYFTNDNKLIVKNGGRYDTVWEYRSKEWMHISIKANALRNQFLLSVTQGDSVFEKKFAFSYSIFALERILFTSKQNLPFNTIEDCGKHADLSTFTDADRKTPESRYYVKQITCQELPLEELF